MLFLLQGKISLLVLFVLVMFVHFVADFMLQTDKMAKNKSSSNAWLTYHILAYTAVLLIVFGPLYALINGLAHWATDWCTSRISKKFWMAAEENRKFIEDPRTGITIDAHRERQAHNVHWFFVVIGFDQFLHALVLIMTLPLLFV